MTPVTWFGDRAASSSPVWTTRATAGLAAAFMVTSITLTILATGSETSITDDLTRTIPSATQPLDEPTEPTVPVE